jgi:hypothetical protein
VREPSARDVAIIAATVLIGCGTPKLPAYTHAQGVQAAPARTTTPERLPKRVAQVRTRVTAVKPASRTTGSGGTSGSLGAKRQGWERRSPQHDRWDKWGIKWQWWRGGRKLRRRFSTSGVGRPIWRRRHGAPQLCRAQGELWGKQREQLLLVTSRARGNVLSHAAGRRRREHQRFSARRLPDHGGAIPQVCRCLPEGVAASRRLGKAHSLERRQGPDDRGRWLRVRLEYRVDDQQSSSFIGIASTAVDWDTNLACNGSYQTWSAGHDNWPINCMSWHEA